MLRSHTRDRLMIIRLGGYARWWSIRRNRAQFELLHSVVVRRLLPFRCRVVDVAHYLTQTASGKILLACVDPAKANHQTLSRYVEGSKCAYGWQEV